MALVIHHLNYTDLQVPLFDTYGGLLDVQFFFVISGYLITESASKHAWKVYALHRFMRIFPAYWIGLPALWRRQGHSGDPVEPGADLRTTVSSFS